MQLGLACRKPTKVCCQRGATTRQTGSELRKTRSASIHATDVLRALPNGTCARACPNSPRSSLCKLRIPVNRRFQNNSITCLNHQRRGHPSIVCTIRGTPFREPPMVDAGFTCSVHNFADSTLVPGCRLAPSGGLPVAWTLRCGCKQHSHTCAHPVGVVNTHHRFLACGWSSPTRPQGSKTLLQLPVLGQLFVHPCA